MWTSVLSDGKKEITKDGSTVGEKDKRKEGGEETSRKEKQKRGRELPVSVPFASSWSPPEIFPKVSRAPPLINK